MMKSTIFTSSLLITLAAAITLEPKTADKVDCRGNELAHLPVNEGWMGFYHGSVNCTTSMGFELYCPGIFDITDLGCSGDRFEIYDNGMKMNRTSQPIFNNCASNSTDPDYTFEDRNWTSGSYELSPGFHNITIITIESPYKVGNGAVRVRSHGLDKKHCIPEICEYSKSDLVVVNTPVPRCEADQVCKGLGMNLANIDIHNFKGATSLQFQCAGAFSKAWIDDWNGDDYMGTCLVLNTAASAPGGAINVPSCCSERLPVICQKEAYKHPHRPVQYECNECQKSCHCDKNNECIKCEYGQCNSTSSCGPLHYK